jgi:TPR repeat protein
MKSNFKPWAGSTGPSSDPETTEVLAERGIAEAQFSLGLRYANGKGAARDYALAEHWYLKAASQNHPLAHFNLGMMHANGQGMPSDQSTSLVWFQKAADLGDAGAQYSLGLSRQRAAMKGLPADASQAKIDAYKWLRLAAAQGYQGAEAACKVVSLDMTREDVLEGSRRVSAFSTTTIDRP